jgi:hypothetical protein
VLGLKGVEPGAYGLNGGRRLRDVDVDGDARIMDSRHDRREPLLELLREVVEVGAYLDGCPSDSGVVRHQSPIRGGPVLHVRQPDPIS